MRRQKRLAARGIGGASVARRFRRRRSDELTRDAQAERRERGRHQHQIGLAARAAILEEQLVAADLLERRLRRRVDAEAARWEAAAEIGVGEQPDRDAARVAREAGPARRPTRRRRSPAT